MKLKSKLLAGLMLTGALCAGSVQAQNAVIDVSGVDAFFEAGNGNTVLYADVAPFAEIVAISWNVNVTAHAPSWLQEMQFQATDLGLTAGVTVTLNENDEFSGTQTYIGRFDLKATGQTFKVGEDGALRVEFFEYFNDRELAPDSSWNYGTLTFEVAAVPEPATGAMALLGAGALLVIGRKRRFADARKGGAL